MIKKKRKKTLTRCLMAEQAVVEVGKKECPTVSFMLLEDEDFYEGDYSGGKVSTSFKNVKGDGKEDI